MIAHKQRWLVLALWLILVVVIAGVSFSVHLDGNPVPSVRWLGRLHPLLVHFPITLLLAVPLLETGAIWRPAWRGGAAVTLNVGVISATVTMAAGIALASADGHEGATVIRHFWGGTTAIVSASTVLLLRMLGHRRCYVAGSFVTASVLAWTAHQGGNLTHGDGYLTEGLPEHVKVWLRIPPPILPETYSPETLYGAVIFPVLDRNCVPCHGRQKQKGGFRIDNVASFHAGGQSHVLALVPHDPAKSESLRRMRLPVSDKKAMPPQNQQRPSEPEVALLSWWIEHGASVDLTFGEAAQQDPHVLEMLQAARSVVPEFYIPAVPSYLSSKTEISELAHELGVRIDPVSQRPGDGLIVRVPSRPWAFDSRALARLLPLANYVVELQLGGTGIDDDAMGMIRKFEHLTSLGLQETKISGSKFSELSGLSRLVSINLTGSALDDAGLMALGTIASLKKAYTFESHVTPAGTAKFSAEFSQCELN